MTIERAYEYLWINPVTLEETWVPCTMVETYRGDWGVSYLLDYVNPVTGNVHRALAVAKRIR